MSPEEKFKTRDEILVAFKFIKMNYKKYDLLIFDEIIDLIAGNVNLITEKDLIEFLNTFKDKEVLVSGHALTKALKENADLVTEYIPHKHYFDKGIKAKKGIEF